MEKENIKKITGTKIFILAIELAFIFAIPAAIASLFAPTLDSYFKTGGLFTGILLVLAFVISWVIVIFKYKKATKEIETNKEK